MRNDYGRAPAYYKGILCSNGEGNQINKGDVLVAFLHKVKYLPQTIIFIDDKIENLENMEQVLAKFDKQINFIGIQYKGAEAYPSRAITQEVFESNWNELVVQTKEIYQELYSTGT